MADFTKVVIEQRVTKSVRIAPTAFKAARIAQAVVNIPVPGPSAYDVAVANGFMGDQAAWLASLEGETDVDNIPDLSLVFENALI